ncbi:transcriptional regulator [Microbacterium sp. SSM24]|uniref:transcriptional regulator n=1 Tax=Microbacterium sp. SSM24 TaxID=2991714 RepID=UPI002226BDE2|nr:transcriptional regulator [Microbacterium sp. SSM24]MCW3493896.1 transcriptional regulator [Microbacterium sp. SSM24]
MSRHEPLSAKSTEDLVASRLQALDDEKGTKETVQVEWRGAPKSLPVISMPLSLLYYNPDTHRIRAQRDFDAAGNAAITADPWGTDAQQYLDYLLSAAPNDPSKVDPAFEKLRDDLASYGQKDAGIITPSGILINGNSRCAALREGNATQMRVAVLPADWSWPDVTAVELELQMRKDYRRDYSFVNTLLALDEAIADVGSETAMKAFRMQKTTFNRSVWILQTMRDLVDRSASSGGSSLNLRDFENDQGKLEELYRTYSATAKSDPAAADLLRESRLVGLLLDKSKTDMRLVTDRFLTDYLDKSLVGTQFDMHPAEQGTAIPGLGRGLPSEPAGLQRAKKLVDAIAKLKTDLASDDHETQVKAQSQFSVIDKAVESALDAAGKSARLRKTQQAAIDKINDAADTLEQAVLEVGDAKSKHALDESALDEAVTNLRRSLSMFAGSVSRLATLPKSSADWLSALRAIKDD